MNEKRLAVVLSMAAGLQNNYLLHLVKLLQKQCLKIKNAIKWLYPHSKGRVQNEAKPGESFIPASVIFLCNLVAYTCNRIPDTFCPPGPLKTGPPPETGAS